MEQLGNFTTVYIEHLVHFDNHPFKLYAAEKLEELAESIKQNGIINPVVVRKKKVSNNLCFIFILNSHLSCQLIWLS